MCATCENMNPKDLSNHARQLQAFSKLPLLLGLKRAAYMLEHRVDDFNDDGGIPAHHETMLEFYTAIERLFLLKGRPNPPGKG
jgi:hypothetical protein